MGHTSVGSTTIRITTLGPSRDSNKMATKNMGMAVWASPRRMSSRSARPPK